MRRPAAVLTGLVLALVGAAVPSQPAAAAEAATTFVTMASDANDYIGLGSPRLWRPGAGSITVSGDVTGLVSVEVAGGPSGDDFTMWFAPAAGETLVAGDYDHAQEAFFQTAGHPGIAIFGSGRGCSSSGRFTIKDIAPDLSRLWILYEHHCDGSESASFGEIRYQEPGGDSDLLVAPGQVAWPPTYPGVPATKVPVRLVNTGSAPVTVSSATITSGAPAFSVLGNGCTTIAVGASCVVSVGFKPAAAGAVTGELTVTDSTTAGLHVVPLSGSGIAGYTSWSMRGNDYIAGGQEWAFTPANSTIMARGTPTVVHLSVDGSARFTADFAADSAHTLEPGATFTGATRYPFNDPSVPGMDVSGAGRGCNTLTGSFTIQEVAWDADGVLQKLAVTFEQHCEGGAAATFGSLAWHADNPPAILPPSLKLATDKSGYRYGQKALVTATLSADSPLRSVSIYATPYGKARTLVTTADVDGKGRLQVRVPVQRRTVFTATFDGQGQFPNRQATRTVKVAAKVVPTMERFSRKSGKYYLYPASKTAWMRGTVSPNHAADCLYFRAQFYVRGHWGYPATTSCVQMSPQSWAKVYLPGSKLAGIPIRMRAEWRGDTENTAVNSPWRYLKFVRGSARPVVARPQGGGWPALAAPRP